MGIDPAKIRLGAIVEAWVPDPRGQNDKRRPLIVIGYEGDTNIVLCAISSAVRDPLPDDAIELPHADRPGGHAATGLNRRCVAVCSWVMVLHGNRIVTKRGDCPPGLLKRITRTVERLADEGIADEGIADDSND